MTFLLKPAALPTIDIAAKERLIQSGQRHYSEMLSAESPPDEAYLGLYRQALERNGPRLAQHVVDLASAVAERARGRPEVVIASLARAGTPVGVLLRRALAKIGVVVTHYSLSIIRDRGIDRQALRTIATAHDPRDVLFVDGWTGKGTIARELRASLAEQPFGFRPFLAVIADPAGRADLAPSSEDYLVPSGLLNSVISGLVSRSVLNDRIVGPGDYHACLYHDHFADRDLSRSFVDHVTVLMDGRAARPIRADPMGQARRAAASERLVSSLMRQHGIADRNRIKPGVAEATRALLRRVPECLLVRDPTDPDVAHLVYLASERGVAVAPLDTDTTYRAVAVVRSVGKD